MSLTSDQQDLAACFVPWARRIATARAILYRRFDLVDEMIASALEGVARAAEVYDPTREKTFEAFAFKWVTGGVVDVIDGENRHLVRPRRAMLTAAADAIGEGGHGQETADEAIDEIDRIAADAMEGWMLGCGAEHRRHGEGAGLLHCEMLVDLEGALAALEPDDARLVELRYCDGLSWKDVASKMDVPEGTLKDRNARIRKELRKRLR